MTHGIGAMPKLNENDNAVKRTNGVHEWAVDFSFSKIHTAKPNMLMAQPTSEVRVSLRLPTYRTETVHMMTPMKPMHEIST